MNNNQPNALDYIYRDIADLKSDIRDIRADIEERLPPHPATGISIWVWEMTSKIENLTQRIDGLEKLIKDPNS